MRRYFCGLGLLAAVAVAAFGAVKPDFSGTWILDKDRSFSNPAGLDQTMTVVHTGDEVKLDARLKTAQGERTITEAWTLDGVEREFTPPTPGATGKRTASWLPGDRGLLVSEVTVTQSQNGPVTQTVARKWTMSRDGRTLTIDYYQDTPRGSFESKRVFIRK